ncbi:hypothetical protein [Trinickia sp. Y13]|uniref:hypothetical protein n=1 Tax=Trinickia sp. Y13 TaxID=2917807 RepID=UPI002406DF6D|nr:hypothetical protein [Trinickia sp. Y13]MDG0025617.1 hypothetical protein [Trinickia sp. Y13]
MLHNFSSRLIAMGAVLALAGCGGGGGDGGSPGAGSSAGSSTSGGSSSPTLAAATAVVDGATLGKENWQAGSTTTGGQGQAVGTLNCATAGNSYSYTHLSIFMNGTQVAVPANIGTVTPTIAAPKGCVYPLNTVDETGKIRMDTTSGASYTLGQFFSVWGEPLTTTNVAGLQASSVTVYVNDGGTLTKYTGDLSSLVLPPHGEVTIVLGTPLAQIPTYTWSDPPAFDPNPITLSYGGVVGTAFWPDGNTSSGGTGADVDGLTCAPGMSVNYHVHAHLAIINNGKWLALPKNIGILSSCDYEMHTHDQTGIIHIEAPSVKNFTLGAFFDIWGQPLTSTNVAGITGDVVAYINDNGEARRYMGDLRAITLTSHRDVTLQIGTPAVSTLATYSWYEPQ